MELEWSLDALEDLDHIWEFIASDNPVRAFSFIEELQAEARKITSAPRMGTVIPELNREEYREVYYRGYNIMYEIKESAILIHEVYNHNKIYIRSYQRADL